MQKFILKQFEVLCGLRMHSIDVIIATYGCESWKEKALIAQNSVLRQTSPASSIHLIHGETLAQARNEGAQKSTAEWLLFLDADDALDSNFIHAMREKIDQTTQYSSPLLYPSVLTIEKGGKPSSAKISVQKPILEGNFMVIGTLVKRENFLQLGGFRELPMYEDWDLWIRCIANGSTPNPVPRAVYHVFVNSNSRNHQPQTTADKIRDSFLQEYWHKVYNQPLPRFPHFSLYVKKRTRKLKKVFQF